jgi:hypothetical protein
VYTAIDDEDVQTEVFDVEGSHAAVRYRRMGSRTGCGRRAATGRCGRTTRSS